VRKGRKGEFYQKDFKKEGGRVTTGWEKDLNDTFTIDEDKTLKKQKGEGE